MKNYQRLCDLVRDYPSLIHASNLIKKDAEARLLPDQRKALEIIVPAYLRYVNGCLNTTGISENDTRKRVALLNEYYAAYQPYYNTFSSQGKLRPTILEEFMYLLLKDHLAHFKQEYGDTGDVVRLGSVKAYSNLYFKAGDFRGFIHDVRTGINQKDQDFAIYRSIDMKINGQEQRINMPALSIEAKTYLDKTMFEGAVATAEKIKNGNPYSKYYVVTENYDVSFDVDPIYSRIDQIFVLRKSKRSKKDDIISPISADVVLALVREVDNHFRRTWSNIQSRMETDGLLI